ncbi:MAG: Cj0069 family protein [Phenylobacterium sp.]|jgi:hypothetical protein|uniref:Cj0069 family protein n=1 Tax=Phenylobacterium sp. TaxID=1871053 RepID=UPI001A2EA1D8|nr:Cj0069 family protein [Phenylobacterium sp.]MBJ7410234.1 Cj0069 family protein [Phenylobacterium sp.]
MISTHPRRIAVVWRGDRHERETLSGERSRLRAIFEALSAEGLAPEPAIYSEEFASDVREQLLAADAVLVWVNPVASGARRHALDDLLREAAGAGVLVSAHPDVIAKMGVKSVLHTTRSLGWGSDTHRYETPEAFESEFPERLVRSGPRVLKQNRSNDGLGVWKVTALAGDEVEVLPAQAGAGPRRMPLAAWFEERQGDFHEAGGLVDQPYQPRLLDGMVRCYMSGGQVVGFGHQLVTALGPPESGPPPRRQYTGPLDPRFQRLRALMEQDWAPGMQRLLEIETADLPVIWDADFLLGPKSEAGEDSYVLCEINASSVFPIPDEAPRALAATLRALLDARPAAPR